MKTAMCYKQDFIGDGKNEMKYNTQQHIAGGQKPKSDVYKNREVIRRFHEHTRAEKTNQ